MLRIYTWLVTCLFTRACLMTVWWRSAADGCTFSAKCVDKSCAGCLRLPQRSDTWHAHATFRAMVCVLTGNDATGWRCHVLYQSLVRWGVFFFHSMFICHFIFLFPDSLSDHPHLPPSQHFCPQSSQKGLMVFFCTWWMFSPSLWPSRLLPTIFTFVLFTSVLHLFGLISAAPCSVPVPASKVKSCFEDASLKQQRDCDAFDSRPFDGGLWSAGDSRLNDPLG